MGLCQVSFCCLPLQHPSTFALQVALVGGMHNSNSMGIYGFSDATLCAFAGPGSQDSTPLRVPVRHACHAQLSLPPVLLSLSRGGHCFMPICFCVDGAAPIPAERGSRVWHLLRLSDQVRLQQHLCSCTQWCRARSQSFLSIGTHSTSDLLLV